MMTKKRGTLIAVAVLVAALIFGAGYLYTQNENAKEAARIEQQQAAEKAKAERIAAEKAAAEKAAAERAAVVQKLKAAVEQAAAAQAAKQAEESAAEPSVTEPSAETTYNEEPVYSGEEPSYSDGADNSYDDGYDDGPEGYKPGFVYVPGYGYIEIGNGAGSGSTGEAVDNGQGNNTGMIGG